MADEPRVSLLPEQWQAEFDLKKGELLLKQSEFEHRRTLDLAKSTPQAPPPPSSPLILAIVTGFITLIIGITTKSCDEASTRSATKDKLHADLILKVIDTGDQGKAINNLLFLVNAGLIDDPTGTIGKLKSHPADAPVLPGPANENGNQKWGDAIAAARRGDYSDFDAKQAEALDGYRAAAAADPSQPIFHVNVGTALNRLGRYVEAARELHKAIDLGGNEAWFYDELCMSLRRLGLADDAKPSCDMAVSKDPGFATSQAKLEHDLLMFDQARLKR